MSDVRFFFVVALVATISCQEKDSNVPPTLREGTDKTPFIPPQVPSYPEVAGQFAKVNVQPHHGPVKVEAPLTRLFVDRQTGDVNLRAGPVALDLDTAKEQRPFKLWINIPKIFNLRLGHQTDGTNV
ncbi:uncharacterized protein LOC111260364 isoform X2 [Varroa jacobsoni]|uniref:Uncharacterized protein n=1 Tax=Varroa destructor TaxID=109461 RepID=A0A7M7JQQ7_VARDE|nr:uncharacterized protein LOC111248162 [Varroa destructor]XP_022688805.1 uncharacterized protein LOC111260364 isoform X2 [Varroa jacobsoni]